MFQSLMTETVGTFLRQVRAMFTLITLLLKNSIVTRKLAFSNKVLWDRLLCSFLLCLQGAFVWMQRTEMCVLVTVIDCTWLYSDYLIKTWSEKIKYLVFTSLIHADCEFQWMGVGIFKVDYHNFLLQFSPALSALYFMCGQSRGKWRQHLQLVTCSFVFAVCLSMNVVNVNICTGNALTALV